MYSSGHTIEYKRPLGTPPYAFGIIGRQWQECRECFQIVIIQSNMEPHQQTKWAGNGDGSNVRLGVRWTKIVVFVKVLSTAEGFQKCDTI